MALMAGNTNDAHLPGTVDISPKCKYKYIKGLSKHNRTYFSNIRIKMSCSEIAKDGLFIEPIEEGRDALAGDGMVTDCCGGGGSSKIWIHRWRKTRTILHGLQRSKGGGELRPGGLSRESRFKNLVGDFTFYLIIPDIVLSSKK